METICYNCFTETLDDQGICTRCGYDGAQNRGKYPMALPQGSILYGRYIVGRVLGQGGFGITYLAQDYQTKGLVAIKEFFPDTMAIRTGKTTVTPFSGERGENFVYGRESFLEEAKTMAEFIGNPNITRVHSYFEENGTGYFVMEYLDGESFLAYIKRRGGRISWEDAMQVMLPVMDALSAMHAKGIIHRDVTPDNIYITKDGTVKLLDFGAARYSLGNVTRSLDVILKHGFAPKEQYKRHGRQGPYTDVYSVAATIYYAITGTKPDDAIERADEDTMPLPSTLGVRITVAQEDALLKGLAVQPEDRYPTMDAFRAALTAPRQAETKNKTHKDKPVQSKKPKPGPSEGGRPSHPKWLLPAITAVAAVAVVLCVVLTAKMASGSRAKQSDRLWTVTAPVTEQTTAARIPATAPSETMAPESETFAEQTRAPAEEETFPPTTEAPRPMPVYVMRAAEKKAEIADTNSGFWGQQIYKRNQVKTVTFRSTLDGAAADAWDVSEKQDGSILAWMDGGDLYVAANGKIAPNKDASYLFSRFNLVTSIDFGDCFDTSEVTDMNHMFCWCEHLEKVDVTCFDTSGVTDMNSMFAGCTSLPSLDVSGFDTSRTTSMWQMFDNCRCLTYLDLSGFDTSRVVEMQFMFHQCFELTYLDLSGFDASNVTRMWDMFKLCSKLEHLICSDSKILAEYNKR